MDGVTIERIYMNSAGILKKEVIPFNILNISEVDLINRIELSKLGYSLKEILEMENKNETN